MFRTAARVTAGLTAVALTTATLVAVAFPLLSAGTAQAAAAECEAVLEQVKHPVVDATREACKAGEDSFVKCVVGLAEDEVADEKAILAACLAAQLPGAPAGR